MNMKTISMLLAAAALLGLSGAASAAPDGKNRKVVVQNLSNSVVRELYASPITAKTWEEDLLGQKTLASGDSDSPASFSTLTLSVDSSSSPRT